jgi:hypothetical protein
MRELVDHVERAVFSPVMGAVFDKAVGPDVIGPLGMQANAGSVRKPKTAALGLSGLNLQPLASPDALDPLVVDDPARGGSQQLGNLAIAIAAVSAGEFDNIGGELLLIAAPAWDSALG